MTRFAAVVLSTMGLIAFGLGAPATYDQRQDGHRNFAGKLENILIVIASPSRKPSKPSIGNSELAAYLSLLGVRELSAGSVDDGITDEEDAKDDEEDSDDDDDDDDSPEFQIEDEEKDAGPKKQQQAQESSTSSSTSTDDAKVKVPKARSLWGQVREVVDNKAGRTLKKELSWGQGQAQDEGGRSSDHNEVGLLQEGHFTLLGDGIEDCGPERRRNSYGICRPYSDEQ